MIVNYNKFSENFSNFNSCRFFLIYGPNYGKAELLVQKITNYLQEKENFGRRILVTNEIISKNKNFLREKFYSEDLFASKRIIYCSLENLEILSSLFDFEKVKDKKETVLIIKAPELDKRNYVRKIFEKTKQFCSIPCYEDTEYETKQLIKGYLEKEKIDLNEDILTFVSRTLVGDRNSLKNELKKIVLFYKIEKKATLEQIKKILSSQALLKIDDFVYEIFSGKKDFSEKMHDNLVKTGISNIQILNAISRHLLMLLSFKENLLVLKCHEEAINKLKPPVFFKNKDKFKNQAKVWSKQRLCRTIEKIYLFERKIKSEPNNSELQIKFMIFSLAKTSRTLVRLFRPPF